MGLAVSVGKDNDELVDNLIDHDSVKTDWIERAMRLTDRGRFMPEAARENAYKDSAWKDETGSPGFLHLSAPCIYASVLENFDLQKGMSFLNIGSGTGYLSTMVGFILGESGVNHGVELYENVVNFANERVAEFQSSKETSAFEWCMPVYFVGNAFQIEPQIQYDRIYCGALVPESHRAYFCSFLKFGGVLIMPYGHALQRITRKSQTVFNIRDISAVTFSHLIPVNPGNSLTNVPVKLPLLQPLSLQQFCRGRIRQIIRDQLLAKQQIQIRNHTFARFHKQGGKEEEGNSYHREAEGEEDEPPPTTRMRGAPRLINHPHLMNHPVVLFEDRENQEGDDQVEQPRRRVMPVRQLFALFARERIHRHHAARARHAAGHNQEIVPERLEPNLDSSDSEEEELEEILHIPGEQPQLYSGPDDNIFGFQFVPEMSEGEEDGQGLHDLFEHFEGGHDYEDQRQRDATNSEREQTEASHTNENEESSSNCKNPTQEVEQKEGEAKVEGAGEVSDNSSASFVTAQNEDLPMIDSANEDILPPTTYEIKNQATKRARQRTSTTGSFESAPQASKIQRKSTTNGTGSQSEELIDAIPDNSENVLKSNNIESMNSPKTSITSTQSTASAPSSSSSSPTSSSASSNSIHEPKEKEEDAIDEIKSEQQNEQIGAFHEEFLKCIDTLPLTAQMRKYIKYEV